MTAPRPGEISAPARTLAASPEPATPPENRLIMPVQSFRRWSKSDRREPAAPQAWRTPWLKRLFVFGGALALTGYGAWEMYNVVSVSRTTSLQYVLLVLFTINFSWIALAFTSAVLGFLGLVFARSRTARVDTLRHRTVVVMPIYNESTARTFAALAAIRESVEATGLGSHFDYFIVSDTTNPDVWVAEERAFLALRERLG
ncbi:MAG: glucan biosynthesis glucosyltransferase H, partial [Bosea sp. (in: a-proteobacteria)]|nr:glucan biosynthesis glucosyltransferase H [Bosea sp. (in: a-proteobacteria)]